MGSFPTYGMAGIGIAAAIGFVFVLSFLGSNSGPLEDGAEFLQSGKPVEQERTSGPDQDASDDATISAKDAGEETGAAPAPETTMMQANTEPTLVSVVALDTNRKVIGEVVPDMEFASGTPVIIQAKFANQNPSAIADHFIEMSVRVAGESEALSTQEVEQGANFQGSVAANSSVALELHWTPQISGDYELLLFSTRTVDLSSTAPAEPLTVLPIKVK